MRRIIFYIVLVLPFCGCGSDNPTIVISEPLKFSEISMGCIDIVSFSLRDTLQVIMNTQDEYDSLIYMRVTKPLQDYWNANYDTVLSRIRRYNPGLSDSEYALLVRKQFYTFPPFRGTDSCSNPSIDFSHLTLLGTTTEAGGCCGPDYDIFVTMDNARKEIIYKVKIIEHGPCDLLIWSNKWILIPKIPESYKVIFQKEYIRSS